MRGIAIAALVLSHTLTIATQTPQVTGLNGFIVAWNMPLFFFVAGWVTALGADHSPLQTAARRARSLLLPYIAWIGVYLAIGYPWSGGGGGVGGSFQVLLAPREMWFLYCLFFASVLFAIVRAVGRRPAVVLTAAIVLALGVTVVSQRVQPGLLTLDNLGWLLPFLAVGYYGCRVSQGAPRWSAWLKVAGAAVVLVLLYWTVGTDALRASMLGVWPLSLGGGIGAARDLVTHSARYVLAAAGIATVWHAVRLLPARGQRAVGSVGTATLGIYALNSPVLTVMRLWFPGWNVTSSPALSMATVLLAASIVLAVEYLITLLLRRTVLTRRLFLGCWTAPSKAPRT